MLSLQHIKKSYDGVPVLQDITLDIKDGEIVSILGPSGCGKTTLLNVILGITDSDEGKILFNSEMNFEEKIICAFQVLKKKLAWNGRYHVGVGAAVLVNIFAAFPIYIQPWSVFLSFAVCTLTGIFFGWYPMKLLKEREELLGKMREQDTSPPDTRLRQS